MYVCYVPTKDLSIYLQCESKKSPLRTCDNFFQNGREFLTKFYMPITCSYLR